jgi:hypothetical protein
MILLTNLSIFLLLSKQWNYFVYSTILISRTAWWSLTDKTEIMFTAFYTTKYSFLFFFLSPCFGYCLQVVGFLYSLENFNIYIEHSRFGGGVVWGSKPPDPCWIHHCTVYILNFFIHYKIAIPYYTNSLGYTRSQQLVNNIQSMVIKKRKGNCIWLCKMQ